MPPTDKALLSTDALDWVVGGSASKPTDGNDMIWGTEGNDTLNGGAGHDMVFGMGGNDVPVE